MRSRVPLERGLIQVAGIADAAEAALVAGCGVGFLGFPLRLPVHREDLTEADAAAVVRGLPSAVHAVLITYLTDVSTIDPLRRRLGVRVVQLHDDIEAAELRRLRELAPDLTIIKSLVVGRHPVKALESTVRELAPLVDGFITDTYAPDTGASGATGRTHDWAVSRRLVQLSPRPVILAGGLTPDNVREAILAVRPAGVDVHTGVEGPDGRKDRAKVAAFVAEARRGFSA